MDRATLWGDWRRSPRRGGLRAALQQPCYQALGTRPLIETEAGSARVGQDYGVLGLAYSAPASSVFRAYLAIGTGALRTTLEGAADSPNQGHRIDQWAFVLEGTLGARFEISERYFLTLAAHAQFAAPYASIHFVDDEVTTTGRPNLLVSLTLGAWL